MNSLNKQIGGSHYSGNIQPIEFIVSNDIPYREACVIKYVFRHKRKNGAEDIKKAIHYLEMILEDYEQEAACGVDSRDVRRAEAIVSGGMEELYVHNRSDEKISRDRKTESEYETYFWRVPKSSAGLQAPNGDKSVRPDVVSAAVIDDDSLAVNKIPSDKFMVIP